MVRPCSAWWREIWSLCFLWLFSSRSASKLLLPEFSEEFIIRTMTWVQTPEILFKSRYCCTSKGHTKNTTCHFRDGKILKKIITGAPSLTGQKLSVCHLQPQNIEINFNKKDSNLLFQNKILLINKNTSYSHFSWPVQEILSLHLYTSKRSESLLQSKF